MDGGLDKKKFFQRPHQKPPLSTKLKPSIESSITSVSTYDKIEMSPLSWKNYYDKFETVFIDEEKNNEFRVYIKGNSGPVFFFLHGGGFSGLSWAKLSQVLHEKVKCQCYSLDIRGHGDTQTTDDYDLSINTLSNDLKLVIESLWKVPENRPQIVLIGHSMGGALAVHSVFKNYIPNLIGLVVIDVVEGTAVDSLSSMQKFLQSRPQSFGSIEEAIEYNLKNSFIRNSESARISIVGQLKKVDKKISTVSSFNENKLSKFGAINEEEDENEADYCADSILHNVKENTKNENFVWRIDLSQTEKYWKEWFKDLSSLFLKCQCPKLLLLAGVDRLDKELLVGQMQGKFQLQVLQKCGHVVHEDSPYEVAEALSNFVLRHRFTELI